ncbi:MAG: tetratricopeptide repeat protein [candidate division WOR-3 bacterium]
MGRFEPHEEIEKILREAIRENPDDPSAHEALGVFLAESGRLWEAEAEFRKALSLDPNNPQYHYNLGKLLKERKKYKDSEREYREAIRLDPDYADAHFNLANLLLEFGIGKILGSRKRVSGGHPHRPL